MEKIGQLSFSSTENPELSNVLSVKSGESQKIKFPLTIKNENYQTFSLLSVEQIGQLSSASTENPELSNVLSFQSGLNRTVTSPSSENHKLPRFLSVKSGVSHTIKFSSTENPDLSINVSLCQACDCK